MDNVGKILKDKGLLVIYDFWVTDRMLNNPEYTEWYRKKYLKKFPKPYRDEHVWK